MSTITIPDDMDQPVQRFVELLQKTNLHKRTWGGWLDEGLAWVQQERKSLVLRPPADTSEVSIMDRLRVALELSGEAFRGPSGLEVSTRVLRWCLTAYARQECIPLSEAVVILDSKPDGDRFWWFMQMLEDPALNALIQILEREWKK